MSAGAEPAPRGDYTLAACIAMVVIGVVASMVPTLQATLLPQLVTEGKITNPAIGQVATIETVGMMLSSTLASIFLRHERLRPIVQAMVALIIAANLASPHLAGVQIMAIRFVHGVCAGTLLWIFGGFIARLANPGRWMGFLLTALATTVMALSYVLGKFVLPWGGAMAGYVLIAACYAPVALLAFVIPPALAPMATQARKTLPPLMGMIGLACVFAQMAAILSLWVYIKPYGKQIGMDADAMTLAVTLGLASQIGSSLVAGTFADKVRPGMALVVITAGSIAAIAALSVAQSPAAFIAAVIAFAFLWKFAVPFDLTYLVRLDPTRQAALFMMPVSTMGAASGPLLASLAVTKTDVSHALLVSAALYTVSVAIVVVTGIRGARPAS